MKGLVTRELPGVGKCEITLEVYEEDGCKVCAVFLIEGTINAKPKEWLRLVRSELGLLENEARKAGCTEMRMAGRFKRNIFPDYEEYAPLSGAYGLRKALG